MVNCWELCVCEARIFAVLLLSRKPMTNIVGGAALQICRAVTVCNCGRESVVLACAIDVQFGSALFIEKSK